MKPMQFEIGKYYKTGRGTRAMYVGEDSDGHHRFAHYNPKGGFELMWIHYVNGTCADLTDKYPRLEIVGEWTEQAAHAYVDPKQILWDYPCLTTAGLLRMFEEKGWKIVEVAE